jgi:hypothetical protein
MAAFINNSGIFLQENNTVNRLCVNDEKMCVLLPVLNLKKNNFNFRA